MDKREVQEMLDAAKLQIERADDDDDERLYRDLMRRPIDEVMVNRLAQSVIRRHDESREPTRRGRPSKDKRDFYIRYWTGALQEQCGLTAAEAYAAIGSAIRPTLSSEAIRSIVRGGK